jgi:hypothetical protein
LLKQARGNMRLLCGKAGLRLKMARGALQRRGHLSKQARGNMRSLCAEVGFR